MPQPPEISIIHPLLDLRGSGASAVRSWTLEQTAGPERFRIVVISDGTEPDAEKDVARILRPHDTLLRVAADSATSDADLANAGADVAGTRWLLFTEGHCFARPDCMQAVLDWLDDGGSGAGNATIEHQDDHRLGRVSDRWFGEVMRVWSSGSTWRRVHRSGFVVEADAFGAIGGFVGDTNQFAPTEFSSRLHDRDVPITDIPNANVLHRDVSRMAAGDADTTTHVTGELTERNRTPDTERFERYFGHCDAWANRSLHNRRLALRMLRGAASLRRGRSGRDLARLAGRVVAGTKARRAVRGAVDKAAELVVDRVPLPEQLVFKAHMSAYNHTIAAARLNWLAANPSPLAPVAHGAHSIVELVPDVLIGVHGLERAGGRLFRWTAPIAYLRTPPRFSGTVAVDTSSLRGDPIASVRAVTANGRRVGPTALSSEGGVLRVRVRSATGIVLVTDALDLRQQRGADRRRLGLPVVAVAFEPA